MSPTLAGWSRSPLTFVTRPSRTCTRSPQPTPQYGHIVARQTSGSTPPPASRGRMRLLLEDCDDRVPPPEVVRPRDELVAAAKPGERHVEDAPDRAAQAVGPR